MSKAFLVWWEGFRSKHWSKLSTRDMVLEAWEAATEVERAACIAIANRLAEDHDFHDGGYEVGRKIAAEIRERGAE